ncbi:MAG: hypothetical protein H6740_23320, partial [Alphaproteobacteria bacterium]|nr:hypothetical protein [Alphaproteobacteria bacterium]
LNGQGLYDGVVELNEVEVYENVGEATHALYSTATFMELGTLEMHNARFADNEVSSAQNLCAVPGFFPFEVVTGEYHNVEILGNRCLESVESYAPGFFHYGYPDASASTVTVENVIIAGNSANSDRGRVWAAAVMEARTYALYQNVSVHGNESSSARNDAGWLLTDGAQLNLLNVDYSGNVARSSGGSDRATGFGDLDGDGVLTARASNLTDLGRVPFSRTLTDPRGQAGNLSVSPDYVDVSSEDPLQWDLSLGARSALIDAGSIVLQDPDGSRSDIGAHGGPGAASW